MGTSPPGIATKVVGAKESGHMALSGPLLSPAAALAPPLSPSMPPKKCLAERTSEMSKRAINMPAKPPAPPVATPKREGHTRRLALAPSHAVCYTQLEHMFMWIVIVQRSGRTSQQEAGSNFRISASGAVAPSQMPPIPPPDPDRHEKAEENGNFASMRRLRDSRQSRIQRLSRASGLHTSVPSDTSAISSTPPSARNAERSLYRFCWRCRRRCRRRCHALRRFGDQLIHHGVQVAGALVGR